jgi:hypothetical protein
MCRTLGDEVKGRVHVGPRVFAHREAVVAGGVTVFIGLVESLAEAGVRRVSRDVLLQGVGEVDPLVAVER